MSWHFDIMPSRIKEPLLQEKLPFILKPGGTPSVINKINVVSDAKLNYKTASLMLVF